MYQILLILLLFNLSNSLDTTIPILFHPDQQGNHETFTELLSPIDLYGTTKVTVLGETSGEITICLSRFGLCVFEIIVSEGEHRGEVLAEIALRNIEYVVLIDCDECDWTEEISVRFEGTSCNYLRTGESCEDELEVFEGEYDGEFVGGEVRYFVWDVVDAANMLLVLVDTDIVLQARYGAVPFGDEFDFEGTDEMRILSPSIGLWYLKIFSQETVEVALTSFNILCDEGTAGEDCGYPMMNLEGDNHITFQVESRITYFVLNGTHNTLSFSVRTTDDEDSYPTIYAGYNRAPLFNSSIGNPILKTYDIGDCESCSGLVRFFNYSSITGIDSVEGKWYIAILSEIDTPLLVWIDDTCPNNCTSQGDCNSDKYNENYGTCDCYRNYSDLYCSTGNFLIENIVMVIVVSVLFITALIGLSVSTPSHDNL